jgi:hypothetical protein
MIFLQSVLLIVNSPKLQSIPIVSIILSGKTGVPFRTISWEKSLLVLLYPILAIHLDVCLSNVKNEL